MNRQITLKRDKIESLGQWWIQWQEHIKETLRKEVREQTRKKSLSPRAFVNEHFGSLEEKKK